MESELKALITELERITARLVKLGSSEDCYLADAECYTQLSLNALRECLAQFRDVFGSEEAA